jgi:hypothetical protein
MHRHRRILSVALTTTASAVNGASSAFDPAQIGPQVVLSNANRRATITVATGQQSRAYTLAGKSSGNFYMEFGLMSQTTIGSPRFGIAPAGASLTTGVGFGATEWAIVTNSAGTALLLNNNTNSPFGAVIGAGDIIMLAVNFTSRHLWFGKNNVWMASGNPAADTNPAATVSAATTYFPCVSYAQSVSNPDITQINSPAVQSFTPPTGFSSWN